MSLLSMFLSLSSSPTINKNIFLKGEDKNTVAERNTAEKAGRQGEAEERAWVRACQHSNPGMPG